MGHYKGRDNRKRRASRRRRNERTIRRPVYGPPLVTAFWAAFRAEELRWREALRSVFRSAFAEILRDWLQAVDKIPVPPPRN